MRRRLVLNAVSAFVAMLLPVVSQSQDTTETVDTAALLDIPVRIVEVSDVDLSCAVWISHSSWRFDPADDESIVDITCVYDVEVAGDRKIERSRIKECRSELKKRNHCWGDDSRDFLRKARKADFTVSYEENSDSAEECSSAASAFTMTVRAQINLEQ